MPIPIQHQQMPALIVFGRPVRAVAREVLPLHGPVLEVDAPPEALHLAEQPRMLPVVDTDVRK